MCKDFGSRNFLLIIRKLLYKLENQQLLSDPSEKWESDTNCHLQNGKETGGQRIMTSWSRNPGAKPLGTPTQGRKPGLSQTKCKGLSVDPLIRGLHELTLVLPVSIRGKRPQQVEGRVTVWKYTILLHKACRQDLTQSSTTGTFSEPNWPGGREMPTPAQPPQATLSPWRGSSEALWHSKFGSH